MRTDGASMPVHMDGSSMSFQKWLSAVRIRPCHFKNDRPPSESVHEVLKMAVRVRIDLTAVHDRHGRTWTDMDGHGRSMLVHHGHGRTVVRGRSMPSVVHVIQNTKEVDSYNFWGKSTLVGNTKYGLMTTLLGFFLSFMKSILRSIWRLMNNDLLQPVIYRSITVGINKEFGQIPNFARILKKLTISLKTLG